MSSQFRTCPRATCQKEFDFEFGKVLFHGTTWDCPRHKISRKQIEVDKAKIEVIAKLPMLKCVKDIRSFLGHAVSIVSSLRILAKLLGPLTSLLAKDVLFIFDEECPNAWEKLKMELISAPIVSAPDWSKPFEIINY